MDKIRKAHKRISPEERLFRNRFINPITHCWEWTGRINRYGVMTHTDENKVRKKMYVHRYSFEIFNNCKIPFGGILHHKCHNTKCFNPEHLELTTLSVNTLEKFKDWDLFKKEHPEIITKYDKLKIKIFSLYQSWTKQIH